MSRRFVAIRFAAAALVFAGAAGLGLSAATAAEKTAAKSTRIKEIMKDGFKGEDSLYNRVVAGKGSKDDKAKLLEYSTELAKLQPNVGDAQSWQTKTAALLKASQGTHEEATGALPALKAAGNCKSCHSVHKPQQKK